MPLGTHHVCLGNTTTWQWRKKLSESAAKSTHLPNQPDTMQHARAHEQQLTLSCHNRSLRAHLKLMLYSDVPPQSTSIKGEATLYSVQHEERNGENGEKERGRGERKIRKWRQNQKGEGGRMKRVWLDLCCLCLFKNKAQHCAPCAGSELTEAEIADRKGRGGGRDRMCSLKGKHVSFYSDTI